MVDEKVKIPISKPIIGDEEIRRVVEVLKSGMVAHGDVVNKFEEEFSNYIGTSNGVAVSNGTVALDVALKALDIGEGDEVITTPFSFIATANAILFQRAKPVFADIEDKTYNLNPESILEKITPKTKAVLGVHIFGHPFDVKTIHEICQDHGLILLEDSAQAHGAEFAGRKAGSFGVGCFSFYATKNITTSEGGMITTSDREVAEKCRLLRNHGEVAKYQHAILGYNFRMTNIQAAIGLSQLEKLDKFNNMRRRNAEFFNRHINVEGLVKPVEIRKAKHVYHQYVVRVEDEFPMSREQFERYLKSNGIGCAVHYPMPIYQQPVYVKLGFGNSKCPVAEDVSSKVLSLPVHPELTGEQLEYIVQTVNSAT